MSERALIVVDMLNDFLAKDGALYCGDAARTIIPFVVEKVNEAHKRGDVVIFIRDSHSPDDKEFEMFSPHSVIGTPGADIIKEIPVQEKDYQVKKSRYSGFYGTDLERILEKNRIEEVDVVGVCTSICVMDTVGGLRNRDIKTRVLRDGVADFDHEAHEFSLKRMKNIYGAEVI
jgi:nicotinamidase-related amidase